MQKYLLSEELKPNKRDCYSSIGQGWQNSAKTIEAAEVRLCAETIEKISELRRTRLEEK